MTSGVPILIAVILIFVADGNAAPAFNKNKDGLAFKIASTSATENYKIGKDKDPAVSQLEHLKDQLTRLNNGNAPTKQPTQPLVTEETKKNKKSTLGGHMGPLTTKSDQLALQEYLRNYGNRLEMREPPKEETPYDDRELVTAFEAELLSRFSPAEMAAYIYQTGDDQGVTLAIQEMILNQVMSPESAMVYMLNIKKNLAILKEQDEQRPSIPMEMEKKSLLFNDPSELAYPSSPSRFVQDLNQNAMLEEAKMDMKSMEELLYQVSKLAFSHSAHGATSSSPDEILGELVQVLTEETEKGHINHDTQKKMIGLFLSSMVDGLSEAGSYGEFLANNESFLPKENHETHNYWPLSGSSGPQKKKRSNNGPVPKVLSKRSATIIEKTPKKQISVKSAKKISANKKHN